MTPYLRRPLEFWAKPGGGKLTTMAIEQSGKSSVWKWGLLWQITHDPCPCLIVYPSDTDAADTNRDSFEPLMQGIPRLRQELERPRAKRKDCFKFSTCSVYFSGAGNDIISKPLKIVIGDEPDFWLVCNDSVSNVDNLDKRGRTFADAKRILVCSPTERTGVIFKEFERGTQSFWHLRCLSCGELSMRSADVHNLQWELDEKDQIIESSLRLICPSCKHEHTEADKRDMNLRGDYVSVFPERASYHESYQWGALATQFPGLRWLLIAQAQMDAGKSASIEKQKLLDNSFRGLPFMPRKADTAHIETIRSHVAPYPDPAKLETILMSADTQDDSWFWIMRGIDSSENTYLLRFGEAKTLSELKEVWASGWNKLPCPRLIIDEGGHRALDVQRFAAENKGCYTYKGSNLRERFRLSENNKLILATEKQYRADLLYYIHFQTKKDNSYWYLPEDITDEYIAHIAALRPNDKLKNGHERENWDNFGADDHFFDCEKMWLVLLDYLRKNAPSAFWKKGNLPWLKAKKASTSNPPPKPSGFINSWR